MSGGAAVMHGREVGREGRGEDQDRSLFCRRGGGNGFGQDAVSVGPRVPSGGEFAEDGGLGGGVVAGCCSQNTLAALSL